MRTPAQHRQTPRCQDPRDPLAAAIFGGGVNAFSRYETGKTRPPLALVKLLDEVRAA